MIRYLIGVQGSNYYRPLPPRAEPHHGAIIVAALLLACSCVLVALPLGGRPVVTIVARMFASYLCVPANRQIGLNARRQEPFFRNVKPGSGCAKTLQVRGWASCALRRRVVEHVCSTADVRLCLFG